MSKSTTNATTNVVDQKYPVPSRVQRPAAAPAPKAWAFARGRDPAAPDAVARRIC